MLRQRRIVLADPVDRVLDRARDGEPRALRSGCRSSLAAAEAEAARQLAAQELDLLDQPLAAAEVVPALRVLQLFARLAQARLVAAARRRIEQLTGVARGRIGGGCLVALSSIGGRDQL